MPNTEYYNDHVVRLFLLASAVWGIIGMLVGMYAAAELAWPGLEPRHSLDDLQPPACRITPSASSSPSVARR
jgi:cbb3-type cytochrome oxidase subunit 1